MASRNMLNLIAQGRLNTGGKRNAPNDTRLKTLRLRPKKPDRYIAEKERGWETLVAGQRGEKVLTRRTSTAFPRRGLEGPGECASSRAGKILRGEKGRKISSGIVGKGLKSESLSYDVGKSQVAKKEKEGGKKKRGRGAGNSRSRGVGKVLLNTKGRVFRSKLNLEVKGWSGFKEQTAHRPKNASGEGTNLNRNATQGRIGG